MRLVTAATDVHDGWLRRLAVFTGVAVLAWVLLASTASAYRSGSLVYAKRVGTPLNQASAAAIAAGPGGAIALAGWMDAEPTGQAPMVASYDGSGARRWLNTYPLPGYARAVAFDKDGNVYMAATVVRGSADLALLKFGAGGGLQWERFYDGPAHGPEEAFGVAVDRAGDVVIAGTSVGASGRSGVVLLKFDGDGVFSWPAAARFDGDPLDSDAGDVSGSDLALDPAGDVYLACSGQERDGERWIEAATTVKFGGSDGALQWVRRYTARGGPDSRPEAIAVRNGRVTVAGWAWGERYGSEDGLVVQYSTAGVRLRAREWGAGDGLGQWFGDVAVDGKGDVFVTGDQWASITDQRAVTVKFAPSLARVLWKSTYRPTRSQAAGWSIAHDGDGNVYVAGVKASGRLQDLLTVKYGPKGARKWLRTWSAGGADDDLPVGLVLGSTGGVYVGGAVSARDDVSQAVLIRYRR